MSSPRLLVTGGAGLVGSALLAAAAEPGAPGFEAHATRHAAPPPAAIGGVTWHALDVADPAAVDALLARVRPAVVVHAAIAVAPDRLAAVAVDGAAHVARAAREVGAGLVHLSSDMVFDGAHGPYDEDSAPAPITAYGRAKADAEARVRAAHAGATIVRLPLLYRLAPPDPALAAWLDEARRGGGYPLFVDEIRRPAQVDDVARALLRVAGARAAGRTLPPVLHLPGPVALSRHEFGLGLLAALGLPASLARAGRSADAATTRPRELDLRATRTPAALLEGIRSPGEVFSAMRAAAPAGDPPASR